MKTKALVVALVVMAASLLASPSWGQQRLPITIGAGHPAGPAIWVGTMKDFLVPEVNRRLQQRGNKYQIDWREAFGGTVAKLEDVLEAIESGVLDMGLVAYPFEPTKLFLHNYSYYVPFGTPDPMQAYRVGLKLQKQVPYLSEVFEKQYNQVFLATTAINNYNLVSTFPVRKVEDVRGRKIAAAGPNLPWVSAVGAIPVQGNLNEAYTSLQSGVYEGWVMFVDGTWGFKLFEVAKHYTFTNFGAIVIGAITVNKDTWAKLPDPVRAVLREVSEEYGVKQVEAGLKKQERGLEAMKQAGTTFFSLPFSELQKWADTLPNIPQQKADEANAKGLPGTEVIRGYITGLEAEGFKLPRRWTVK
ncbi:MAG: C4-dicarboxylate TRAP transporter substrate-binding protein [Candidatus Rokubacteria bacterium]|nr:C4-dicarboxylate TRAP transporter substrate-binding protein [Candidatus Rokubacteria bacterium]